MFKKEITLGSLLSILLSISVLFVGGIVALNTRIAITEERNKNQDREIQVNKNLIDKNKDKTDVKLDKIIDLIIELNSKNDKK